MPVRRRCSLVIAVHTPRTEMTDPTKSATRSSSPGRRAPVGSGARRPFRRPRGDPVCDGGGSVARVSSGVRDAGRVSAVCAALRAASSSVPYPAPHVVARGRNPTCVALFRPAPCRYRELPAHLRGHQQSGVGRPSHAPVSAGLHRAGTVYHRVRNLQHPVVTAFYLTNSEITCGPLASKPTTSSMPASFGSAIEKPLLAIPATIRRALGLIFWRYSASA